MVLTWEPQATRTIDLTVSLPLLSPSVRGRGAGCVLTLTRIISASFLCMHLRNQQQLETSRQALQFLRFGGLCLAEEAVVLLQ